MLRVGYHASQEQFAPSDLLAWARLAEAEGFDAIMSSDHFHPWSVRQGQSGFAWSWLGAAMSSSALPFGLVTSPVGFRYHPAVIAQAAATLAEMFPRRLWVAVGSGENLNEHIVAQRWPPKQERNERLREAVEIMRGLFAGETVSSDGLIPTDRAKLFTRPAHAPLLVGAALSEATARFVASWADALIMINLPPAQLERVIRAFRDAGGEGKPVILQAHVSWARTEDEAMQNALDQWGINAYPAAITENLATPEEFDSLFERAREEDVRRSVHVSSSLSEHAEYLRQLADAGASEIYVHNVGRDQAGFIKNFGAEVLPALRGRGVEQVSRA